MTARFLFTSVTLGIIGLLISPRLPAQPATSDKPIRIGIIGLDTSHVIAFTQLLNDPSRSDHVPGARVVPAFKSRSPDVETSATRIEKFTPRIEG